MKPDMDKSNRTAIYGLLPQIYLYIKYLFNIYSTTLEYKLYFPFIILAKVSGLGQNDFGNNMREEHCINFQLMCKYTQT